MGAGPVPLGGVTTATDASPARRCSSGKAWASRARVQGLAVMHCRGDQAARAAAAASVAVSVGGMPGTMEALWVPPSHGLAVATAVAAPLSTRYWVACRRGRVCVEEI